MATAGVGVAHDVGATVVIVAGVDGEAFAFDHGGGLCCAAKAVVAMGLKVVRAGEYLWEYLWDRHSLIVVVMPFSSKP